MLTNKDIIKLILFFIAICVAVAAIIWLIIEVAPLLIVAIVFIPWLVAALASGANVK